MKPKVSLGLKLDTTVQVTDADIQSPRHQVPEEYQKISGKTNENDDDGDQQEKSSDKDNTQDSRSELNRLPGDDAPFKPRELSTVQPHNDEVTVQPIISDPVEKPTVVEAVAIPKDEGSKVEVVAPPLPNLITQVAKEQPVATPAVTKQKQSFWSRLCCCAAEEEPSASDDRRGREQLEPDVGAREEPLTRAEHDRGASGETSDSVRHQALTTTINNKEMLGIRSG